MSRPRSGAASRRSLPVAPGRRPAVAALRPLAVAAVRPLAVVAGGAAFLLAAMSLVLVGGGPASAATVPAAVLPATAVAATSALPTYVVQPGDSFWGIAQEDGLTVGRLAAANGLVPTDVLLPGEVLRIPAQGPGGSSTGSAPVPWAAGAVSPGASAPPVVTVAAVGPGSGGAACPQVAGNAYGVLPAVLAASPARQVLLPLFRQWAAVYGVSPALVEAIAWQESGWQAGVVSPSGAVGIGQLLPATVRFIEGNLVGVTLDPWSANDNIRMMTAFVAYLAAREGGEPCATIAAYYEGPGALASVGVLPVSVPYIADVEALVPQFE